MRDVNETIYRITVEDIYMAAESEDRPESELTEGVIERVIHKVEAMDSSDMNETICQFISDAILEEGTKRKQRKLKAVSMVVDKVDRNGNLFTRKAMEVALKDFTGCSLGYEFNPNIPPIGVVTKAVLKGDKMEIEAEVGKPFNERLVVVPSFTIKGMHEKDGIKIIDDAELISFSLTSQPADDGVTKIPI